MLKGNCEKNHGGGGGSSGRQVPHISTFSKFFFGGNPDKFKYKGYELNIINIFLNFYFLKIQYQY